MSLFQAESGTFAPLSPLLLEAACRHSASRPTEIPPPVNQAPYLNHHQQLLASFRLTLQTIRPNVATFETVVLTKKTGPTPNIQPAISNRPVWKTASPDSTAFVSFSCRSAILLMPTLASSLMSMCAYIISYSTVQEMQLAYSAATAFITTGSESKSTPKAGKPMNAPQEKANPSTSCG